MKDLMERLKTIRNAYDSLERSYGKVNSTYSEPPTWLVVAPFLYEQLQSAKHIDQQALALLGSYLAGKYPALWECFLHEQQRDSLGNTREILEEFLKKYNAKKAP